ncbi:hypothetical protein [Chitinilyticum piscinae]|uniref:Inhibitor of g-type lysozyme n=1 Tax=Chitinilyticum piscinae TaxID=2866724 RepID=A0A8J7K1J0_9NEIS|nr:hypothetical protein [Chitinilyticum piscinae]MBE9609281.1 hypothetical protein [Chitinilyticum piscinae]
MSSRLLVTILTGLFLTLSAPAVLAQDPLVKPVHFAKGSTGAVLKDSIKGYQYIDYRLTAKAGQQMQVELKSNHGANYFNILPPGSSDVALFNSSTSGNTASQLLPDDGEYTVRVYLMRSAARRNESANFTLKVAITGSQPAVSHDAKVSGTPYHATGPVPCEIAGKAASCTFGVERQGKGSGTLTVTRPDGGQRVIFFEQGKATGYDQSQADRHTPFKATHHGDETRVSIGKERYTIPDAVLFGG